MHRGFLSHSKDEPLQKTAFTKPRREHTGLGLSAAKRDTDRALEGKTVLVLLADREKAETFAAGTRKLGAKAGMAYAKRPGR